MNIRIPLGALTTSAKEIAWDGEAADGQWSNPKNWIGDVLPGIEDIAIFSAELPAPSLIDSDATIGGIELSSSFVGQLALSPGVNLQVGQFGFRQAGGRFNGGDGRVQLDGSLYLTGGEFVAPSTTLTLTGNMLVVRDELFKHNAGTVELNGSLQAIAGTVTFNNVHKKSTVYASLEFASSKQVVVDGELVLTGAPAASAQEDRATNFLQLRASGGEPAVLEARGPVTVAHVSIQNVLSTGLSNIACDDCVLSGATSGWLIPSPLPTASSTPVSSVQPSPTTPVTPGAVRGTRSSPDFAADEPVEFVVTLNSSADALTLTPLVAEDAAVATPSPEPSPSTEPPQIPESTPSAPPTPVPDPTPSVAPNLLSRISTAVVPTAAAADIEGAAPSPEPSPSSEPSPEATGVPAISDTLPPQDVTTMEILDPDGQAAPFSPQVTGQEGKTVVTIPKPPDRAFRPGKYTLNVTAHRDGQDLSAQQDFTWGVLAVNFDQSSYRTGEDVTIGVGVLDDRGTTVCDAQLVLDIATPDGDTTTLSTEAGTIRHSDTCANANVTDNPDYAASLTPPGLGAYAVTLTATHANGSRVMKDAFTVTDDAPFVVRRRGVSLDTMASMRIFPPATYTMTLEVTARQDFTGTITEEVPSSFAISDYDLKIAKPRSEPAGSTTGGPSMKIAKLEIENSSADGRQKISSEEITLLAGETALLTYVYDAPDVSPEFYLLGPLDISDSSLTPGVKGSQTPGVFPESEDSPSTRSELPWQEPRAWQIAADAEVTINNNSTSTSMNTQKLSPSLVFIDDSTGYAFFSEDTNNECGYAKTTNGGASWGAVVELTTTTDCRGIAVWYDRWTPGDTTGTFIHIAVYDITGDDLLYERLNTSDDTQLGQVAINTTGTAFGGTTYASITRATNGTLYAALSDNDANTSKVQQCSTTCGTGSNWSDVGTSPLTTDLDRILLMPLASGSVMLLRTAVVAADIESNVWNGSTWAGWVDIDTAAPETTRTEPTTPNISATVDKSDNNIYLAYGSDWNTTGADIRTAIYNGSTWDATTADVISDQNTLDGVSIFIDENNDDLYVAYLRGTINGTINAYYKKSTDGMASWGGETQWNTTATDINLVQLNVMSNERVFGRYVQDTTQDVLLGNTLVDLTVPVAGRNRMMIIN